MQNALTTNKQEPTTHTVTDLINQSPDQSLTPFTLKWIQAS